MNENISQLPTEPEDEFINTFLNYLHDYQLTPSQLAQSLAKNLIEYLHHINIPKDQIDKMQIEHNLEHLIKYSQRQNRKAYDDREKHIPK